MIKKNKYWVRLFFVQIIWIGLNIKYLQVSYLQVFMNMEDRFKWLFSDHDVFSVRFHTTYLISSGYIGRSVGYFKSSSIDSVYVFSI